jgi:hypothetical protein
MFDKHDLLHTIFLRNVYHQDDLQTSMCISGPSQAQTYSKYDIPEKKCSHQEGYPFPRFLSMMAILVDTWQWMPLYI